MNPYDKPYRCAPILARVLLAVTFLPCCNFEASARVALLTSQIGYEPGESIRAMARADEADGIPDGARFQLIDAEGAATHEGKVFSSGYTWGVHWWTMEIPRQTSAGEYRIRVAMGTREGLTSDPISIKPGTRWNQCFETIAFDFLETRAKLARSGKGWKDCGSDLQELSSHVVTVDCLCDILEKAPDLTSSAQKERIMAQIVRGMGYIAMLQDRAMELGLGGGPVVHESRQSDLTTGNTVMAAMIFARTSRLLKGTDAASADDYRSRAVRAYQWIKQNGPIIPDEDPLFFAPVHGAPAGSKPPPGQWMTRDLLMMARAALELHKAGLPGYQDEAIRHASAAMERQISKADAEGGLHGHFWLYDDFSSFGGARFSEKAVIHCGAWSREGRIYNKGGHYPHHLIPLIEMLALWPDHADARAWKRCLRDFAYGYFLPACKSSPFLILPNGYYRNAGLQHFGSWYHGQSSMYSLAAILALEFENLFKDPVFHDLAVANVQWVAGLNCGWRTEKDDPWLAYSLVEGIGHRSWKGWSGIKGSTINGFSASPQFKIQPADAVSDKPAHFDDEDYIAHSLPFLAASARLESRRRAGD
jgi:hypothetical protein